MRIIIKMNAPGKWALPIDHIHMLQGAIYHAIDPELSAFLHDQGYVADGRTFRLFCFSRLLGSFKMDKQAGKIVFDPEVQLVISSPIQDFLQAFASALLRQGSWRLGSTIVSIAEISVLPAVVESERLVVKTLSPVTTYSTMIRPDGRKYTVYFQPGDPDYDSMITANLKKKYKACYGTDAPEGNVYVQARGTVKMNLLQYKGTVIKGYSGTLQLEGPKELLQIAVDAGLGSKNSQGFGCIEILKDK